MAQKVLGVDIGSYSIKVAEIERSLRGFELVGFYEQPLLSTGGEGQETTAAETRALQRLFEEYNLTTDFVYSALPGQKTSLRTIELPFGNLKKIDTTIEFEMENYLPLPLEEVTVDYQVLTSSKTESQVLVSYARKGELIKFLNLFAAAELDPRFVGSEPVELSNLIKLGVAVPEGAYAIVDIGHEKTNLSLFLGKNLQTSRTIMIGGKNLTRSVSETLKIPEAEAERIKIEMGNVGVEAESSDPMTRQVSQALVIPLEELVLQIRQTLFAFQQERGEVVQAIVLTGGSSRLAGLDQYFSRSLRRNVSFLDGLDIPMNRLQEPDWCRPIAATALSLAYRGVVGTRRSDIQFRRGEFTYKGEVRDLSALVREVAIQAGIITFFVFTTFLISYAGLKGKIKAQEKQLAQVASAAIVDLPQKSLTNPKDVLAIVSGRLGEMNEKKKKIREEVSFSVLQVLKELSTKVPTRETLKLDVDDLTLSGDRVRITGRTGSFEAVDQIKSALSASSRFQNVSTDNVRKAAGDQVKFDISLEFKVGENPHGA